MPKIVTVTLIFFLAALVITILSELLIKRDLKRFLVEIGLIAAATAILNFTVGFPESVQSFGGVSPVAAIGIMFVCVILGIAGRYMFSQSKNSKFSWYSFAKPLFISPIVLLPLIGSIQATTSIAPIQMISLAILAYQNGFFWKVIVDRTEEQMKKPQQKPSLAEAANE